MRLTEIVMKLKLCANPKNVEGMERFGINPKNTLGVSIPVLRRLAGEIKKEYKTQSQKRHKLAQELWDSEIHEARLLAGFIDDNQSVTEKQMEEWVKDFDSWDICDQICSNLFDKTRQAYKKAKEWAARDEEFIKRAGFVLMATLSVHDKKAEDNDFLQFFPLIEQKSTDERNFVRKAVNWALRQIGKRNERLRKEAIKLAQSIKGIDSKSARWIANDALRELQKT